MNCSALLEFCKFKIDFDDPRIDNLLNSIEILDYNSISFSNYFIELEKTNVITNNMTTLINRVNILFSQIYENRRSIPSMKLYIGLHILTYYFKHISAFSNEEMRKQFSLSNKWPDLDNSNQHIVSSNVVFELFIKNLINIFEIYDNQLSNLRQLFYHNMLCLISFLNKDPNDNSNNLVMEYLYNFCNESIKINHFNNSLAASIVKCTIGVSFQNNNIPLNIHTTTKRESIITKVFSFILNSWNFNLFSAMTDSIIVTPPTNTINITLSIIVLLLLLYGSDKNNPVKQSFICIHDSSLESEICSEDLDLERGHLYTINISFQAILDKVSNDNSDPSIMLLYSFLNLHHNATEYLISSKSITTIFNNLLKGIYHTNSCGKSTYMLVICLVQLTQDSTILEILSKSNADTMWMKERRNYYTDCLSLNLCVSSILKMIISTLHNSKDLFILSNCFAILLNISSKCNSIDTNTGEKLMRLIDKICKKIKCLDSDIVDATNFQATWFVLYKFLTISLAHTINTNANISFLYTMLQFYSKIESILTDPYLIKIVQEPDKSITDSPFEPFVTNGCAYFSPSELLLFLKKYLLLIETKFHNTSYTAHEALIEIKKELTNEINISSKLNELESLFTYYQYQEENNNELFFKPYIWKIAKTVFL